MNKVQKLENNIVKYAITLGGVNIRTNRDFRQLRKGIRLTHKLQGERLSYYDWLCNEKLVWHALRFKQAMQEVGTIAREEM